MTQTQALTQVIILAITIPSDHQAKKAIEVFEEIAQCLTRKQVEQCKADALLILESA
jgi:hypothetical protein